MPRVLLVIALWLVAPAGATSAEGLAVIVHPQRAESLDTTQITQVYLKQRRFWADGTRIVPINREAASGLRDLFVRRVLGTSASRLVVYWNRQYFQGVLPPATLASDEAVMRFVASERAAIGYVDLRAIDDSVRVVLELRDSH